MPVTLDEKVTVEYNGERFTGSLVEVKQTITIVCENPNCQRGGFDSESQRRTIKSVTLDPQNPDSVPDEAWEVLYIVSYDNTKRSFCSKGCLQSFLQAYKPLKSPRQSNVVHFPDGEGIVE